MINPRSIAITGASSGIGRALAEGYAGAGFALALCGRDAERLEETAAACRAAGARVMARVVDVRDAGAVADWLAAQHAATPLDLVIANAGISAGTGGGGENAEQARRIFGVNLDGVLNTVLPAIELMDGKEPQDGVRGQIAIMSSLASFRGFPGAPAYCGSKAAVRVYGESLRGALAPRNIEVSVVCPGFVETGMTAANTIPMPLLMGAGTAARIIRRRLARNQGRIAFPWRLYQVVRLLNALPPALTDSALRLLPKKARAAREDARHPV